MCIYPLVSPPGTYVLVSCTVIYSVFSTFLGLGNGGAKYIYIYMYVYIYNIYIYGTPLKPTFFYITWLGPKGVTLYTRTTQNAFSAKSKI